MPKPRMKALGRRVELKLTSELRAAMLGCPTGSGGSQNLYRHLDSAVVVRPYGTLILDLYDSDVEALKREARRKKEGTWQDTARSILDLNDIRWQA